MKKSKTIPIHRWHDYLMKTAKEINKETIRSGFRKVRCTKAKLKKTIYFSILAACLLIKNFAVPFKIAWKIKIYWDQFNKKISKTSNMKILRMLRY